MKLVKPCEQNVVKRLTDIEIDLNGPKLAYFYKRNMKIMIIEMEIGWINRERKDDKRKILKGTWNITLKK